MDLKTGALLDLTRTLAGEYLAGFSYPWEALDGIKDLILTLGPSLNPEEYEETAPQVWVHKTARVAPAAYLGAPCIIGPETEVRHCAFVRGWQLRGAEKRHSLRRRPDTPLQLCGRLYSWLQKSYGSRVHYLQREV